MTYWYRKETRHTEDWYS